LIAGRKKKYIKMFGSFTDPFSCVLHKHWDWSIPLNSCLLPFLLSCS